MLKITDDESAEFARYGQIIELPADRTLMPSLIRRHNAALALVRDSEHGSWVGRLEYQDNTHYSLVARVNGSTEMRKNFRLENLKELYVLPRRH